MYNANTAFNSMSLVLVPHSIRFRPCERVRLYLILLISLWANTFCEDVAITSRGRLFLEKLVVAQIVVESSAFDSSSCLLERTNEHPPPSPQSIKFVTDYILKPNSIRLPFNIFFISMPKVFHVFSCLPISRTRYSNPFFISLIRSQFIITKFACF